MAQPVMACHRHDCLADSRKLACLLMLLVVVVVVLSFTPLQSGV